MPPMDLRLIKVHLTVPNVGMVKIY